jgi:hypothetical protein
MTVWRRPLVAGATVLSVGCFCAGSLALAQNNEAGGLFAQIDFSAGLIGRTGNAASEDVTARAGLSFGLNSTTRNQVFRIRGGADLELDRNGVDLVRPNASLAYLLSSRTADLSFDTAYSEIELDNNTVDQIEVDDEVIANIGRRTSASASVRLVTGKDALFGTDTLLSWSRRDYADTINPNLFASTTTRAETTLRFDVTPTARLRLTASQVLRDDEDTLRTDRTTTQFGVGADTQIDPVWSLSADLSTVKIETIRDPLVPGPRVTTSADGLDGAFQLARALENGNLTFGLRREFAVTGGRTVLDVGRSMTLRNGNLAASLGVVRFENGETSPVASLSLNRQLTPTSVLNASLQRTATVNADDQDTLRTRLTLGYDQQINEASRWNINLGFADTDVQGGTGDNQRIDLGVGYSHALTKDWDLSAGLNQRLIYQDGVRGTSITTLSLNVERRFLFRP